MFIDDRAVSRDARIAALLDDVRSRGGGKPDMLRHMIATSGMESNYHVIVSTPTVWGAKHFPCGVAVVGLELGKTVNSVAWADRNTRNYLVSNALVSDPNAENPSLMNWSQKIRATAPLGKRAYALFEDMIRYNLKLVMHFSIGPTQMHLLYGAKELGGQGTIARLPQTRAELIHWYAKSSRFDWYNRVALQYPKLPTADRKSRIAWLKAYQVGYATGRAEAYHDGTAPFHNSAGGWNAKYQIAASHV